MREEKRHERMNVKKRKEARNGEVNKSHQMRP